jgi:hypothetical protein
VGAGSAAGLAIASKETAVLALPASVGAAAAAWGSIGSARATVRGSAAGGWPPLLAGAAAGAGIALLFYTSFFTDPGAILRLLRAAPTYVERGVDPAAHYQPWHYYLGLLAWSRSGGLTWTEAAVLGLAAVGAVAAWVRDEPAQPRAMFWRRYLTANALLAVAVFSAIPYKTPWNLLPFHAATIVAAGIGVSALGRAAASRAAQAAVAAALAIAAAHLGWQAWRAAVVYAADPRNPYVYSQTVPDAVRMAARIRDLAALHPERERMTVMVVAPPHEQWPLPWYLRAMPHVGYWPDASAVAAPDAPVIVSSMGNTEALDAALGDRYVSEFFGVRPDVLLTLYIERGLWDRFLARAAAGDQLGGT